MIISDSSTTAAITPETAETTVRFAVCSFPGRRAWLEKEGEGPFPQVKGGTGAPLTVILRPLLVEDGVCRQFEVPPLAAAVAPPAVTVGVGEVGWGAEGP